MRPSQSQVRASRKNNVLINRAVAWQKIPLAFCSAPLHSGAHLTFLEHPGTIGGQPQSDRGQ